MNLYRGTKQFVWLALACTESQAALLLPRCSSYGREPPGRRQRCHLLFKMAPGIIFAVQA